MAADAGINVSETLALAVELFKSGRLVDAQALCRRMLEADPENVPAMQLTGTIAFSSRQYGAAVAVFERAKRLAPERAELHDLLGRALRGMGRHPDAVAAARQAVRLAPMVAEMHFNLGNALRDAGDRSADAAFEAAVQLSPGHASAWFNLGMIRWEQGRVAEAAKCFAQTVRFRPAHAKGHINLAQVCAQLWRLDDAERSFRAALALAPNVGEVHGLLANVLLVRGRVEESLEEYRKALSLTPDHPVVQRNYLLALNYSDRATPDEVFEAHRQWGIRLEASIAPMALRDAQPEGSRRLRVGYVSQDLRDHPVWRWFEPVLRHHDRDRFEVFCYSGTANRDACTEMARGLAEHWRDLSSMSVEQAARLVAVDGIDILVDLGGHTSDLLRIFVHKPARVQVSYLGYPNTTGLKRIDYVVTDELLDPPGERERLHSERLCRLPGCFSCYKPASDAPEVNALPALEAGLVTFGSFNNISKVSASAIRAWSAVLNAAPGSRLLLKPSGPTDAAVRRELAGRFIAMSIDASRVEVMARQEDLASHLAVYHRVDIALDSYPYHGTTTTCDALWMGVPVVSLMGPARAARVGGSLLNAMGLGHLAARSEEEFVSIAKGLASDLEALSSMRGGLRQRMAGSTLTNGASLTGELERAYEQMWRAGR